jgi:hypothetical protein
MGAHHTAGVDDNGARSTMASFAGHLGSPHGQGTFHDAHPIGFLGKLRTFVPSTKEGIAMS